MITQKSVKLSITLLLSTCGYATTMQGMQWTGKEKIFYLLDNEKKVVGCTEAGIGLPEPLENVKGRDLLTCTPFSGMQIADKEKLHQAFLQARESGKKVVNKSERFGVEQTIKILPIKLDQETKNFMVRLTWLRLGVLKVNQPCVMLSKDDQQRFVLSKDEKRILDVLDNDLEKMMNQPLRYGSSDQMPGSINQGLDELGRRSPQTSSSEEVVSMKNAFMFASDTELRMQAERDAQEEDSWDLCDE